MAAFLVPRARTVAARGQTGRYIKFLTLPRAMLRFLTAPLHSNRFFDGQGMGRASALHLPCWNVLASMLHLTGLVSRREKISAREKRLVDRPLQHAAIALSPSQGFNSQETCAF